MKKDYFDESEVLGYIEEKLRLNVATEDEEELYINYKWNGYLDTKSRTYHRILTQMEKLYYEY